MIGHNLDARRTSTPSTRLTDPPDTNEPADHAVIPFVSPEESAGLPPRLNAETVIAETTSAYSVEGDLSAEEDLGDFHSPTIAGKRVALVGRFGSMNHREATNVLESFDARVVEFTKRGVALTGESAPHWVVLGAEEPPLSQSELLGTAALNAAASGEIEILHESELWHRIGLVDLESSVRRYHTPAMLADLLGVSVRVIRRWHRLGLITPIATVHKLPYFDYAEVATAKRLAGWIAEGASPSTIERRLVDLLEVLPNIRRPLDQLSILVEGKHVLLRQGDGLIEPGGQMRFDFDSATDEQTTIDGDPCDDIVAFRHPDQPPMLRAVSLTETDDLLIAAYEAEDRDDLESAVAIYHTLLARDGMRADICFQIGELLYRMNRLYAARERYYATIEVDPEFVEARASLGGVLAELGQNELAIAAFRGALKMHHDYADVHYSLARTLDKVGREDEATEHWQTCLSLAPDSAWGEEARERLGL